MDIMGVLKNGIEVSKKNYIIFVPTIAVMAIMFVLSLILIGVGAMMAGVFLISIIGMILGLFAHGMTIGMAKEAIDTGSTSLASGINIAVSRFVPLLIAAIVVGIIVTIGLLLLIIPGLIAAFLLMFTFVAIVVDNMGAVEAMKKSFEVIKSQLSDAIILFIALIVVGVIFIIANMILNVIPFLGQLLGMILMGIFTGYISVVIVMAYKELTVSAPSGA